MIETQTKRMMRVALDGSRYLFLQDGHITPVFFVEDGDGHLSIVPVTFDGANKSEVALILKLVMHGLGAVRYVFASEAWMVGGVGKPPAEGSVKNHPNRIETIQVYGEDHSGQSRAWFQILRPEHGKPKLGAEKWLPDSTRQEYGRFAGLLPTS